MKEIEALLMIADIDAALIEEASTFTPKKRKKWNIFLPVAASLLLIAGVFSCLLYYNKNKVKLDSNGKIDIYSMKGARIVEADRMPCAELSENSDPYPQQVYVSRLKSIIESKSSDTVIVYGTAKNVKVATVEEVVDGCNIVWNIATFDIDIIDDFQMLDGKETIHVVAASQYVNRCPNIALNTQDMEKMLSNPEGLFILRNLAIKSDTDIEIRNTWKIKGKKYKAEDFADYFVAVKHDCDGESFQYFGDVSLNEIRVLSEEEKDKLILIDEEHFGGKNFCAFLRNRYDMNLDGFFSETERTAVKEINFILSQSGFNMWGGQEEEMQPKEPEEMKGFELFPKLERVCIDYADRVVIRQHPSLKEFCSWEDGSDGGYIREVVLEDCPNLEMISYVGSRGNLFVKNCGKLAIYAYAGTHATGTLSFSQTPNLYMVGDIWKADITWDADTFFSCSDILRRLDDITLEKGEGEQLLLQYPPGEIQIRWNGVKKDYFPLSEGFPLLYIGAEEFQDMYFFELFDKKEDIYDEKGRKGYNICVTYQGKRESEEALSLYLDGVPEIENFYLRPEQAEEIELYEYSPNKGVLFCAKWNLALCYRNGEEEIVLGNLKNKQKQIWFIDEDGNPRFYESRQGALRDNGIRGY